ncbi:MAG: pseudouridine synthase [Pirellulaceae bacterium]
MAKKRASKPSSSKSNAERSSKRPTKRSSKRTAKKKINPKPSTGEQRLNKILAGAGLGSRREVEELIVQGRVEVDREIVSNLAFKTDPSQVTIKVDGQALKKFRPVYHVLNKPKGVLSTNRDPSGRARVIDFIPGNERVFSVGRLDKSSEGLVLLTNDGELAQKLAHPRFRIQKTYFVVVSGVIEREELDKLRKGVYLSEGFARIDGARIKKRRKSSTELEITLSEGKNREIRRLLARAGHKVVTLRRIAIASLRLGQIPVGASRPLTAQEVRDLYAATQAPKEKKTSSSKGPKTRKTSGSKPPAAASRVKGRTSAAQPATDEDWDDGMDDEVLFASPITSPNFEDSDDDFVGFFDNSPSEGSVLGYDDDLPTGGSKSGNSRGKKPAPRRASRTASSSRGTKRASGGSASGKRGAGSPRTAGGRPAQKKASGRGPAGKTKSAPRGGPKRGGPKKGAPKKKASGGKRGAPKSAAPKRGGPKKRGRR